MILVGISGAIDHGKTSFADFLTATAQSAIHYESSDVIMEVANRLRSSSQAPAADDIPGIISWLQVLPRILADYTHVQVSFDALHVTAEHFETAPQDFATLIGYLRLLELQPELTTKPINASNKEGFRTLLQWLGGYLAKTVSGRLWFDEIIRRGTTNGAELILASGIRFPEDAACIRQAGGIVVTIIRPAAGVRAADDVTERERSLVIADVTVINDSLLADLQTVAKLLYSDLMHGSLQTEYTASAVAGQ